MARTIKDLIDELDAEGDRFTFVGLVVGFEKTSTFIWAHEGSSRDRHEKLREAVRAGGEPVGMVGFVKDPEGGKFYARPLQEYIGEQWVENYLAKLLETTAVLRESLGADVSKARKQGGWLN
jgi:hypothetical protein